jgi:hypothetical protein
MEPEIDLHHKVGVADNRLRTLMSQILSGPARVYVYDITTVLQLMQPVLSDIEAHRAISVLGVDGAIDAFLEKTIHDFEVVSVWEHLPGRYPSELNNLFIRQTEAISELYRQLYFPPECSGSMATIRRIHGTLWLVVFDPMQIGPYEKPKTEHVFH